MYLLIDLFNYLEGVVESLWFKILCKCNHRSAITMMINILIITRNIPAKVDFRRRLEAVFSRGVGSSSSEGRRMVLSLTFTSAKLMFLSLFLVAIAVHVFLRSDCKRHCHELKRQGCWFCRLNIVAGRLCNVPDNLGIVIMVWKWHMSWRASCLIA